MRLRSYRVDISRRVFSVLLALIALFLIVMGSQLIMEGGSFYYLLVGIIYTVSAILLWKHSSYTPYTVFIALIITLIWSFYEIGSSYWGLFPRILVPLGLFAIVCLLFTRYNGKIQRLMLSSCIISVVAIGAFLTRGFLSIPLVTSDSKQDYKIPEVANEPVDWSAYSRDTMGTRYSPFTQINRDNVKNLKLAWTYRTGRNLSDPNQVDQNTPLQIANTLYTCTPENNIHAINATTGKLVWKFEINASTPAWSRCRGLGYYHDKEQVKEGQSCTSRIISNTVDGRLFALDAATGKQCEDFGKHGSVDLRKNMGPKGPGLYYQTSAPLIADNLIVVGGWIADNQGLNEPSGAIRAFDVHSGKLVWTWDPGNSAVNKEPLNGDTYTLGTPNSWTHTAYDPKLRLIYVPMGNAGTDYFNRDRPEESRQYNSALVALDVNTGKPRWAYQTVHDDIWDYDLPSQPALLDMKNEKGELVPAVIQLTKRGQIFALDRRTGEPIAKVEEKPVPTKGSIPENRISPTQPYSVGMPQIGEQHLTESSAWGMTMFDQLMCRISFKKLRYDGDFTLPGLKAGIFYPGALGGFNWGSASYDPHNHRLFVNDIRVANVKKIVTREEYEHLASIHAPTPDGHGLAPMEHTPYGITTTLWASPLGVPCQQPPYGTITAIDLDNRKIDWQVPAGTTEDTGPFGIKTHLPLSLGMPTYAGTSVTAGGLVFFAGTQDYYLRAFDAQTGKEVWKTRLPVGASATPMVYISPENGKEYIAIAVGGAAHSPDVGDYIMAYALP
ncbi:membrane-bound PQQ-dependent dehydrogenase, glucose/quinate/shikimate family [Acinetobacter baumannii]|nr:membrane-bound PQQ-dependent dehydrogenase, glucose/quinate/shikimate family [Acinetobacter baumannii]